MKQLEKKDLVKGEIYKYINSSTNRQIIFTFNDLDRSNGVSQNGRVSDDYNNGINRNTYTLNNRYATFFEATPEEKHWLEVCIAANSFISYEEAMKTFIPEYVECIAMYGGCKIGEIYDTKNDNLAKSKCHLSWYQILVTYPNLNTRFKPSTKEAYDVQFVVKEPEFVLPKLWCIKLTNENQKTVIDYINKNSNDGERNGNIGMYYGYNGVHCTCIFKTLSTTEITFDQFKQYVLKENTTVTEKPKVVLEEPKDKVLTLSSNYGKESIVKVECSEGGVYRVGDKITVFDKNSPNKGKVFTIKGFRWNNAKTNICAITELHTPNGIGLDKIELYSEPVVKELSLLEQAKLKYPIGTKIKSLYEGTICTITKQSHLNYINSDGYCKNTDSIWFTASPYAPLVYREGQWAEIVEDFKLPKTWKLKVCDKSLNTLISWRKSLNLSLFISLNDIEDYRYITEQGYGAGYKRIPSQSTRPEITFEQFEQYVLHNGFKVGDRFDKQRTLYQHEIINVAEKEIIDLQYINNQSVAFYKYTVSGHTNTQCRILTRNIVR